jgi:hypothetical protein
MAVRNRKISAKRLLDLILGGRAAGLQKEVNKELQDKYSRIVKKLTEAASNFRALITENTPAVYIVDCRDIAQTIALELSKNKTTKTYGTTNQLQATFGGEERILDMFNKTVLEKGEEVNIVDILNNIMQDSKMVDELAKALYTSLNNGTSSISKSSNSQTGFISGPQRQALQKNEFRKVFYNEINTVYKQYLKEVSIIMSSKGTEAFEYSKIELKGIELGKKLREKLQNISTFIATDKVVKLPNNLSVVVVANTFQAAVDAVNKNLEAALLVFLSSKNSLIIQALREYDPKNKNSKFFKLGDLINAGHTAAFISGKASTNLLGVNMPSAQTAQQTLNTQESQDLEIELGSLYADINYNVEFLSSFGRRAAGGLIDLQFAIAISMPAALNSKSLKNAEVAIVNRYKKDIKDSVLKKFLDKKGTVQKAFIENAVVTSKSPTVLEKIKLSLIQALLGKEYSAESAAKNIISQRITGSNGNTKPKGSSKIVTKGGKAKSNSVSIKYSTGTKNYSKTQQSATNLPSLLNRINGLIQQQVQRNMGTGTSKTVLNYRTGRFANSVKVERLSESRQGMITAFYSYMKNPYATFSQGGRQQNPRSRDPKTLIAKSIREIAQTMVTNQLRAVNV